MKFSHYILLVIILFMFIMFLYFLLTIVNTSENVNDACEKICAEYNYNFKSYDKGCLCYGNSKFDKLDGIKIKKKEYIKFLFDVNKVHLFDSSDKIYKLIKGNNNVDK